jgi:recombination protein RecA
MITRAGTYYNYGDVRLGQGRDNAREFLDSNTAIFDEIDTKVREQLKLDRIAKQAVISTTPAAETTDDDE